MNTDVRFELDSSAEPYVCVVRIVGHMSVEGSVGLHRIVRKNMGTATKVVLNLLEVTSIDSGGIGELMALYLSLNKGDMVLCPSKKILFYLKITHLSDVVTIFESEEEAVRSFRS